MKKLLSPMLCSIIALSAAAIADSAQRPDDNAALRYWMAFAQMNDSQIPHADAIRMDAMINNGSSWDEKQFGPIVEQNKAAIETMIRGSRLPYCEWGLEWELGPETPIEYVPKARALARLNNMYSMHLASTGDYHGAARSTIAGIRFAQHLAENGSFLGALIAKSGLIPALMQAERIAASNRMRADDLASLRQSVSALPEGGFDWSSAVRAEGKALHSVLSTMSGANARSLYEKWFGSAPEEGFHAPTKTEIDQLDRVMESYARLLGMPPEQGETQLPALQKQITDLDPTSRRGIPDPERMLAARTEIVKAQRRVKEALKYSKGRQSDQSRRYAPTNSFFSLGSYSTMYPATALAATVRGEARYICPGPLRPGKLRFCALMTT
jgi:hypothetical protein